MPDLRVLTRTPWFHESSQTKLDARCPAHSKHTEERHTPMIIPSQRRSANLYTTPLVYTFDPVERFEAPTRGQDGP
jgi:hypothetical protein